MKSLTRLAALSYEIYQRENDDVGHIGEGGALLHSLAQKFHCGISQSQIGAKEKQFDYCMSRKRDAIFHALVQHEIINVEYTVRM